MPLWFSVDDNFKNAENVVVSGLVKSSIIEE